MVWRAGPSGLSRPSSALFWGRAGLLRLNSGLPPESSRVASSRSTPAFAPSSPGRSWAEPPLHTGPAAPRVQHGRGVKPAALSSCAGQSLGTPGVGGFRCAGSGLPRPGSGAGTELSCRRLCWVGREWVAVSTCRRFVCLSGGSRVGGLRGAPSALFAGVPAPAERIKPASRDLCQMGRVCPVEAARPRSSRVAQVSSWRSCQWTVVLTRRGSETENGNSCWNIPAASRGRLGVTGSH